MKKKATKPKPSTRRTTAAPRGVVVHRPCWGLTEKLEALRYCIAGGHDEDAQCHLFDLLSALRLRAAMNGMSADDLTPDGRRSLALLSPNVPDQATAKGKL